MPVIGKVGRRSFKVRFLNTVIHLVLIIGAVTMAYPFLIMLSGSVKSPVDSRRLTAIPSYFYSEKMLFKKWMEAKYNEDILGSYGVCYRRRPASFSGVEPPVRPSRRRYEDWNAFLDEAGDSVKPHHYSLGNAYGIRTYVELHRVFLKELKAEPDVRGDLDALNAKYDTKFATWDQIGAPSLDFVLREASGGSTPFRERILAFEKKQSRRDIYYFSLDSVFVEYCVRPVYAQGVQQVNAERGTSFRSWADVRFARRAGDGPLRDLWLKFVRTRLNLPFIVVSQDALPDYQAFLEEKYEKIDVLNRRYNTAYKEFSDVPLIREVPDGGVMLADWDQFVASVVKDEHLSIESLDSMYREFLRKKYGDVGALIAAQELGLRDFDELPLIEKMPGENLAHAADWADFARMNVGARWVGPDAGARREWIRFLTAPYKSGEDVNLSALNAALDTEYTDAMKIPLPMKEPSRPKLAERWLAFLRQACPPELLRVDVREGAEGWDKFIRDKYADVGEINRHYRVTPADFDEVEIPTADADWFTFVENKWHIFREFMKRNYAVVFQMMLYNGYAIRNTLIYCALAVGVALLINPLAAYALSRYKPPSQYKLLLLMMLTMAFPAMVLGIPNFLLLRDLRLLNTFAALVLPGAANGYMIFILKGFFDSLPRELYESAQIDGASEWTMFWQISMATSKPILAVIGLGAFTAAYGNFMLAFIVCQDRSMWTMMVHIYQLQGTSSQSVAFAALVVAAIPMLLVFIFCQNIIIRGIVVPTEK